MPFITVKRGVRPSLPSAYVSSLAKTVTFSTGFIRTYKIDLNKISYIRLAFDNGTKELAVEFTETKKNDDEYMKITFPYKKKSASCSINPVLATFLINVKELAGTYKERAIVGPVKIDEFSDNGFILKTKYREI